MYKLISILLILGFSISPDSGYIMNSKQNPTVNEAIEGIYTFRDNELSDNPNIVGYQALYSGNYYFSYLNFNDLSESSKEIASKFCFTEANSGKYKLEFSNKIAPNASIAWYNNQEILATITFIPNDEKGTKVTKKFLIRNNKDKKHVYFHSTVSELQLWNISKPWQNSGIAVSEAYKIADKEATRNLKEVNESEFAKSLKYKFKVEDYNKNPGLCIVSNQIYWYILYIYTFKHVAKDEIHFAGHPAHFTVRVNQQSGETQFLHGE